MHRKDSPRHTNKQVPTMKIDGHDIDMSNRDKVLFPDDGITKGDLIDYYERIATTMLPYVSQRPLTLHRFPDGIDADGFYQQNAAEYFPDWVVRVALPHEDGNEVEHCVCDNAATLVYLANLACITPHVWLARAGRPHHPDRMLFDLDPGEDDFATVRRAAHTIHAVLGEVSLASFVMTTGSRGLHVVVPLDAEADFDATREFARRVAEAAVAREPDRLTTEQRKDKRGQRLYVDIMRNAYGQTAVAPYAVRARPGAPVAMPLEWDELDDSQLRADRYRIDNAIRRLGQKPDAWSTIERHVASLRDHEAKLDKLENA